MAAAAVAAAASSISSGQRIGTERAWCQAPGAIRAQPIKHDLGKLAAGGCGWGFSWPLMELDNKAHLLGRQMLTLFASLCACTMSTESAL